jgi:hypothetical protein
MRGAMPLLALYTYAFREWAEKIFSIFLHPGLTFAVLWGDSTKVSCVCVLYRVFSMPVYFYP